MDLFELFVEMLNKPDAVRVYRDLQKCYKDLALLDESAAIAHLIEHKFGKKDEVPPNSHSTD